MELRSRQLGAPQDESDLRAVPMREEDVPALRDHAHDVPARFDGGGILVGDLLVFRILDERVAADGDDRDLAHSISWVVVGARQARIPLDAGTDAGRLSP